jgi:hypothetical protein
MREQVKFGTIRTEEEFRSLQAFAASFDHEIGSDAALPIYTIERGDQVIGYFNVVCYPILGPAFHPAVCSPRDFFEAVTLAKSHFCINTIDNKFRYGTCLLALRKDLKSSMKTALMRCGFKNLHKEIWQAIP